jgi:hypothetical protein
MGLEALWQQLQQMVPGFFAKIMSWNWEGKCFCNLHGLTDACQN